MLGEALHRRLVRALRVPSPRVGCEPVLRQLDRLFRLDKTLLLLYCPGQVGGRLGAPVESVVILVEAGGRDVGRPLGGVLDLLSEERLQVLDRLVPAPQPAVALPPEGGAKMRKIAFYDIVIKENTKYENLIKKSHLTLSTSFGRK